jgi:hypothetical protein
MGHAVASLVKRLPRNTEVSTDARYIQLVSRLLQNFHAMP